MFINALFLDKEQLVSAMKLVSSDKEWQERMNAYERGYDLAITLAKDFEEAIAALETDASYDEPWKEFEAAIGRELTSDELDGRVPLGFDGTEEEYNTWKESYIARQQP